MRLILAFIFLYSAALAQTPVGFNKWQVDDSTFTITSGAPSNVSIGGKWRKIKNDFRLSGDSLISDSSIIKTVVKANGTIRMRVGHKGQSYVMSKRLTKIGFLNIANSKRQIIDSTMRWVNYTDSGNTRKWKNVSPGVDYHAIKKNGEVIGQIHFKRAFIDSAIVRWQKAGSNSDVALANVVAMTLSSNIDSADAPIGYRKRRVLKKIGKRFLSIGESWMKPAGGQKKKEVIPEAKVGQFWRKQGSKIVMIEYVMMSDVLALRDFLVAENRWVKMWHSTTSTFTLTSGTDSTTCVEVGGAFGVNRSAFHTGRASNRNAGIIFQNVTVPNGASVSDAHLVLAADVTDSEEPVLLISCEDADNISHYSTASNYDGRARTTANTTWTLVSPGDDRTSGTDFSSPSFDGAAEEVFARGGWSSGDELGVFIKENGSPFSESINYWGVGNGSGSYPVISITYTAGGGADRPKIMRVTVQ